MYEENKGIGMSKYAHVMQAYIRILLHRLSSNKRRTLSRRPASAREKSKTARKKNKYKYKYKNKLHRRVFYFLPDGNYPFLLPTLLFGFNELLRI